MSIKSKNLRVQRDRTVKEPQPLPSTSENGDQKPPRPPVNVAGEGGMFDRKFIEGYLRSLRDSLADSAYGGFSDKDSELMHWSR
ncbi:hypothetical protein Pan241w_58290 [Gimesia alba]|uniref:Uncharacterized protein n=1 Tax=Gimesia alba TaxID=2527973 RepID=A0A517RPF6_9PLAN|nr:hypothetical protein Pan241w_58290 [Gimesia alba]